MSAKEIRLSKLFRDCKDLLRLQLLNSDAQLDVRIGHSNISRPGLLLTGFGEGFKAEEIQILDEAEVLYLEALPPRARAKAFRDFLDRDIPCVIITGNKTLPESLADISALSHVPFFSTPLSASEVIQYLNSYLLMELAPQTSLNGTLVDVYGVGILLRGKSGIGKSECALDLVQRGHRLVADDLVRAIAKPPGILIGRSSEPIQNYVEVRGIGLVDIGSIFGIRAVRRQKRIEVEVNLREWDKGLTYDRSGLECGQTEILGIRIPSMVVPLVPGKSVSVIVEVIALSHILKVYGYDAAAALNERWIERLKETGRRAFEPRDIE